MVLGLLALDTALAEFKVGRVELREVEAALLGEDTSPILATFTPPVVVIGFLALILELLGDMVVIGANLLLLAESALGSIKGLFFFSEFS